jgi:hypothetical protein
MFRTSRISFLLLFLMVTIIFAGAADQAARACDDTWFMGPWLIIVTGVETYDYAVWITPDGLGVITNMGAFSVPDPAGTYAVQANCDMSGQIWTEGYTPFTGQLLSVDSAVMNLGPDSFEVLRVTDPGALQECWSGWFQQDNTGVTWNVTLDIDAFGNVVASTGFSGPVSGRIFTQDGYLAGFLTLPGAMGLDQIMFQEAASDQNSAMSGTYHMDCEGGCPNGTFELIPCSASGVAETPPVADLGLTNHPNPFNPGTIISFSLASPARVTLHVLDLAGRLVRTLREAEQYASGRHEVPWDGKDDSGRQVASGTYFYRLEAGSLSATKAMVMVK